MCFELSRKIVNPNHKPTEDAAIKNMNQTDFNSASEYAAVHYLIDHGLYDQAIKIYQRRHPDLGMDDIIKIFKKEKEQ